MKKIIAYQENKSGKINSLFENFLVVLDQLDSYGSFLDFAQYTIIISEASLENKLIILNRIAYQFRSAPLKLLVNRITEIHFEGEV